MVPHIFEAYITYYRSGLAYSLSTEDNGLTREAINK